MSSECVGCYPIRSGCWLTSSETGAYAHALHSAKRRTAYHTDQKQRLLTKGLSCGFNPSKHCAHAAKTTIVGKLTITKTTVSSSKITLSSGGEVRCPIPRI